MGGCQDASHSEREKKKKKKSYQTHTDITKIKSLAFAPTLDGILILLQEDILQQRRRVSHSRSLDISSLFIWAIFSSLNEHIQKIRTKQWIGIHIIMNNKHKKIIKLDLFFLNCCKSCPWKCENEERWVLKINSISAKSLKIDLSSTVVFIFIQNVKFLN